MSFAEDNGHDSYDGDRPRGRKPFRPYTQQEKREWMEHMFPPISKDDIPTQQTPEDLWENLNGHN